MNIVDVGAIRQRVLIKLSLTQLRVESKRKKIVKLWTQDFDISLGISKVTICLVEICLNVDLTISQAHFLPTISFS